MATKPKRIEDMSEAELIEQSGKAYNKARTSPEPGGFDIKPMVKRAKAAAEDREADMSERASRTNAMGDTYKKGGKVSSASSRADGIAQRGKTKGTMVMCGGGKV
jgi:hypothetical protein